LCQFPLLHLSAAPVCPSCWSLLRPQTSRLCRCCGEDLGIAQFSESETPSHPEVCRPCELVPPGFDQAIAFGVYESTLRQLIHLLKYDRMEPVARRLASRLAPMISQLCKDAGGEVLVVPVPLHRSKRKERGFNQSELLAEAVIASVRRITPRIHLKIATGLLERKRATQSQSVLTTTQRRRNLRGAFFVAENQEKKLASKDVLLIDDIYTTGATARACSKALKDAGAARVWVATIARAQRDGVARWDAGSMVASTGFASDQVLSLQ
jgi:ComF family protein